MPPYNLDVDWSVDDLCAATKSLKECKEINVDNPLAAAKTVPHMWTLLNDALSVIEREADQRDAALHTGSYGFEMRNLVNRIEAIIFQATKRKEYE